MGTVDAFVTMPTKATGVRIQAGRLLTNPNVNITLH